MKFVLPTALVYIFSTISQAALIDSSSSSVKVKNDHIGQEYSYTIQENKAFAIDPAAAAAAVAVIQPNPLIKIAEQKDQQPVVVNKDAKIPSYAAAVPVYSTVPLIQPYAYVHAHGYVYPYNLVAVGAV